MKVAVIGAGTMGSGIAQAFAQTEGYEVILTDINLEFAQKGQQRIAKGLQSRVDRGKLEQAVADQVNSRINAGVLQDCADCDLVVEAVLEEMAIKKADIQSPGRHCQTRMHFCQQHLFAFDHRDRAGVEPPPGGDAFFQSRAGHETG